ncbi:MAG TPA: glycosyltransferase family 9 protein [Pyrinomonadaceae bacterium]|nr:glycosyltransferase family 9 protein [Pyrinomonadaceae bacterium]
MTFNPCNILIIDFGQLGDVVMSLPALRAIREKFPQARLTIAVGKPGAEIINLSGYANETIEVDRVALRDGFKPLSILKVFDIVKDVRRRNFDFVIDLHSFSETNLLGFFSGAPQRLFARRPGRSLDFLANFKPGPPVGRNDPKQHLVDRYLDVLKPLGIKDALRTPKLLVRPEDDRTVDLMLRKAKADAGSPLVGIFPGAGHPCRRWPIEKFSQLADFLIRNDSVRPIIFVGPEERHLLAQFRALFPPPCVILDKLSIPELAAAQSRLAVFVSNDTGPMHIAAAVGTPVVLLIANLITPHAYIPLANSQRLIFKESVTAIEVEEVYAATRELLTAGRTSTLFAS